MMTRIMVVWVVLLLGMSMATAEGVVVYKSTSADGKVRYTDHPPTAAHGEKIEVIVMPAGPDAEDWQAARERTQAELEASREVTDRMAADRREREAALRQAALEQEEQAYRDAVLNAQYNNNNEVESVGDWVWPVYGYGDYYRPRPGYPGYPGKPPRPIKPRPEPRAPAAQSSGNLTVPDLINRSRPWR
jgi:hypothetical protein